MSDSKVIEKRKNPFSCFEEYKRSLDTQNQSLRQTKTKEVAVRSLERQEAPVSTSSNEGINAYWAFVSSAAPIQPPLTRLFTCAPNLFENRIALNQHIDDTKKEIASLQHIDLEEIKNLIDSNLRDISQLNLDDHGVIEDIDRSGGVIRGYILKAKKLKVFNFICLFNQIYELDKNLSREISSYLLSKVNRKEGNQEINGTIFYLLQSFKEVASQEYSNLLENGTFALARNWHDHVQSISLLRNFRVAEEKKDAQERIAKHTIEASTVRYNTPSTPSGYNDWKTDSLGDRLRNSSLFLFSLENTFKINLKNENGVEVASCQGLRNYMEDDHVIYRGALTYAGIIIPFTLDGVLDGHGGRAVVDKKDKLVALIEKELQVNLESNLGHVNKLLVYRAFKLAYAKFQNEEKNTTLEELLRNGRVKNSSGSTSVFMFQIKGSSFFINNGDSRAILIDKVTGKAIALTKDQTASGEEKGIKKRGANVFRGRVSGILSPGRSLGNITNSVGINPRPKITTLPENLLEDFSSWENLEVILATDGFWDVYTPEYLGEKYPELVTSDTPPTKQMLLAALNKGSEDNITVMRRPLFL
jgi:serine/threonine protein phosphatase PrpC